MVAEGKDWGPSETQYCNETGHAKCALEHALLVGLLGDRLSSSLTLHQDLTKQRRHCGWPPNKSKALCLSISTFPCITFCMKFVKHWAVDYMKEALGAPWAAEIYAPDSVGHAAVARGELFLPDF